MNMPVNDLRVANSGCLVHCVDKLAYLLSSATALGEWKSLNAFLALNNITSVLLTVAGT